MFGVFRSTYHKKIAGVLAGVAERFSLNVTVVRLLYIVFFMMNMLLATAIYMVAAFILPAGSSTRPRRIKAKKVKSTDWSKF